MWPRFSVCNELFQGWPSEDVFEVAARLGYEGVEIAPYTLSDDVRKLTANDRTEIGNLAASNEIEIVGLHWILASPSGLHLTHSDESVRNRTRDYIKELLKFTADIGGSIVVLGSPKQRSILAGVTRDQAWSRARDILKECCKEASSLGVDICLEPLSRIQTDFINTAEEAVAMVNDVNHPNLRVNLDVYSMSDEGKPLGEIVQSVGPLLRHFHANDTNGRGPGQGNADYPSVVRALRAVQYEGFLSVEVFDKSQDPVMTATESINNLTGFFRSQ